MGAYLDKLKTTLSDIQSRQITNLLVKNKESGEIGTLEEFRNRLNELTGKLLSEKITPSLELFFGQFDQLINSDTFNFMLERIRDDLEAAFSESNSLSEVLSSHKNIINNVLLKSIQYGVTELESKVNMYEFLASNRLGLNNAIFNTFKASQQSFLDRTSKDSNILFRDPRSKITIIDDAVIDISSESLFLRNTSELIPVKTVRQIFDEETPQSEDQVGFQSSKIENIIDNSQGTFWSYSILQRTPKSKIFSKIELDLGNYSEINFILIEAANPFPFTLERIEYFDSNNQLQSLTVEEEIFNTPKNIYISHILTNKIFLLFSQSNFIEVQYSIKDNSINYDQAVMSESSLIDIESIETQIKNVITSSKLIKNTFLLPESKSLVLQKFYDYSIGFDNIKVGRSLFKQNSIFVSSPIAVDRLAQIALKSKEKRPVEISGSISMTSNTYPVVDEGQYFHGSIEYWATSYNYDEQGQLIDIITFPILPIGINRIYHENLILSNQIGNSSIKNAGRLMFYCDHLSEDDISNIKVYRNGTLLIHETDWVIEDFLTNDIAPPSGTPNSVGIKIIFPTSTDFYTVSYSPVISNTRALPINSVLGNVSHIIDQSGDGTVRIGLNNIIYISDHKNGGKVVDNSKLYLSIILRRSSPDEHLSPSVEEYLLSFSSANVK